MAKPTDAEVKTRKVFFFLFVLFEIAFIILFRTVSNYAEYTADTPNNMNFNTPGSTVYPTDRLEYIFFVNIITMTLIGYGLLYSYNRAHGFTAFLYTLLISGVTFQWALLMNEFWERVNSGEWSTEFFITIPSLIKACYTTTAVLITFGTIYGRANIVQLVFIAGFEALAYALNRYIIQYQLNTNEIELAIFVHVFGAFFGLGVSLFTSSGPETVSATAAGHDGSTQDSNIVSVLGTLILFVFFPSYNAFVAAAGHRSRVIVNTFLATTSSALVTFAFSALTNGGKWRMSEIRNATIAGGVAMASSISVLCGPAAAAGTGLVAAIAVQVFIKFIHPKVFSSLKDAHYTHATHAIAGLVAAVGSMIAIADAYSQATFYGDRTTAFYPSGENAAGNLVAAYFVTVGMGLFQGIFVGGLFGNKFFARISGGADY